MNMDAQAKSANAWQDEASSTEVGDSSSTSGAADKYETGGVKLSFHGYVYQYLFLWLFVFRSFIRKYKFKIAAEEQKADKFDDLVYYHNNGNEHEISFIQLKHKQDPEKKKIKCDEVLKFDEKNSKKCKSDYSILKYFESFLKIQNSEGFRDSELKEFILCTNTTFDFEPADNFIAVEFYQDDILKFQTNDFQAKRFKINKEAMEMKKMFCWKNKDDVDKFVDRFYFVVNYPSEKELRQLLENEMGEILNLENSKFMTCYFETKMMDYLKNYDDGKAWYYTQEDADNLLKDIREMFIWIQASGYCKDFVTDLKKTYPINFKKSPKALIRFVNQKKKRICYVKSKTTYLTAIKVLNTFNDTRLNTSGHLTKEDGFIMTSVKDLCSKEALLKSFLSKCGPQLLLLICEDCDIPKYLIKKIQNALKDDRKKIIIISNKPRTVNYWEKLNISRKQIKYIKDKIIFEHLDENSQNDILSRKIILQGKEMKLNQLVDKDAVKCLRVINCFANFKIPLKIDDPKPFLSPGYSKENYIERTFGRSTISFDVINNRNETEIYFITGCDFILKSKIYNLKEFQMCNKHVVYCSSKPKLPLSFHGTREEQEFLRVCEQFQSETKNIHWLHNENAFIPELVWIKTKGSSLAFKDFIMSTPHSVKAVTEKDMLNLINEEKYAILTSDAGYGKSTVLTSLAIKIKSVYPDLWIVRINLNEYAFERGESTGLKDIQFGEGDTDKAIEFLSQIYITDDKKKDSLNVLKKELFHISLKTRSKYKRPKIVLIFDAFDEISPTFKEKTIKFLRALKQSNAIKIFVTSRNHEKFFLEIELKTPAYYLKSFIKQEQIEFCNRSLKSKLKCIDEKDPKVAYIKILKKLQSSHSKMQHIFKTVINKYSRLKPTLEQLQNIRKEIEIINFGQYLYNNSYDSTFFGTPLNLGMLIELVYNGNFAPLENLDQFDLYMKIEELRRTIYFNDKASGSDQLYTKQALELQWETVYLVLLEIAVKATLPENKYNNLPHLDEFEKFLDKCKNSSFQGNDTLLKMGLLVQDGQRLKFEHLSFAEFYTSIYLFKHFHENNVVENILFEPNGKLIRIFFENQINSKEVNKRLLNVTKEEIVCKDNFILLLKEGRFKILRFILEELGAPDSNLIAREASKKLMDIRDDVLESNDKATIKAFFDFEKLYLDDSLFKHFLLKKNWARNTLHTALSNCNTECIQYILEFLQTNLERETVQNLIVGIEDDEMNMLNGTDYWLRPGEPFQLFIHFINNNNLSQIQQKGGFSITFIR